MKLLTRAICSDSIIDTYLGTILNHSVADSPYGENKDGGKQTKREEIPGRDTFFLSALKERRNVHADKKTGRTEFTG